MKARFFGFVLVMVMIVGAILIVMPKANALSAKDGWKDSFSQYCKSYTNLGACGSTSGGKWFSLLQRNDAANTTKGDCGDICSTNWFSTSGASDEKLHPNDKVSVPAGLKDSDKLPVWMYSSQRVNRKQSLIKSGQSTYELFVTSRIGSNFSIKGDKGKKTGYIDITVGPCTPGTPNPYTGPVVIQRPGISGMSNLGKYGGTPTSIVNDGVQVYFNVGWLRKTAADYKAGKISKYVNVFQGLFYHGPGASNASGCANIQLNAANIEIIPSGDIYPQLSETGTSEVVMVGSDTKKVASSMLNSRASTYQIASKVAAYDFEADSINDGTLNSLFSGSHGTRVWNAGTNSVDSLCSKLPTLFGTGISGISDCSKKEGTYSKATYSGGTTPLDGSGKTLDTSDKPVGTIMCRVLITNNFNGDNNGTKRLRASSPACFVVGKSPKLAITGGDLRAGGGADTSKNTIRAKTYGSWVEYGAFIGGADKEKNVSGNFGSGASFRNGSALSDASSTNQLTFANTGIGGGYGKFGDSSLDNLGSVYDFMGSNGLGLPVKGSTGNSVNASNLSEGFYDSHSKSITIHQTGTTFKGTMIIKTSGTVTISSNIKNDNPDVQLVIIAKNINIRHGVGRVDAWLLASGTVKTCSDQSPTTKTCSKALTINGPVIAQAADFKRTANSDKDTLAKPAERLNMPSNTYLWEYRQSLKNTAPTTVQVTQLPPRY